MMAPGDGNAVLNEVYTEIARCLEQRRACGPGHGGRRTLAFRRDSPAEGARAFIEKSRPQWRKQGL